MTNNQFSDHNSKDFVTKNKPWVVIFIGPTASGKSTLGELFYEKLQNEPSNIKFYDGDSIRKKLKNKYSHSLSDRFKVLDEYLDIVYEDCENGYNVILSTVLHKNKMREIVKNKLDNVFLIYLHCDIKICEKRDFKGHYKRARRGEADCVPGVTEKYEYPDSADLIVNTDKNSISESLNIILNFFDKRITSTVK
jgi:adenylylsulfate kinase